jgi:hypothetical protein
MDTAWFEVWWDYSSRPPILLLLSVEPGASGRFVITEPNGNRVHATSSYEAATFWLTEDEFTRVDGRTRLED